MLPIKALQMRTAAGGGGPTAYRYFRTYITANNDASQYVAIMEWEGATSAAGSNIFSGATATAIGSDFGWVPSRVNDGSTAEPNGWHSSAIPGGPWWIYLDLGVGNSAVLYESRYWIRSGGGQRPKDFKIQGSNDASAWTDLKAVTNWSASTGTFNTVVI